MECDGAKLQGELAEMVPDKAAVMLGVMTPDGRTAARKGSGAAKADDDDDDDEEEEVLDRAALKKRSMAQAASAAAAGGSGLWTVAPEQVVLPAISQGAVCAQPLQAGDTVFVLGGGWREAVVEHEDAGAYLLMFGDGTRRLAALGEICWHDVAPMPYDIAEGKLCLGWDATLHHHR